MFNIASFLDKFSKNIKNSELEKEQIQKIIKKFTNIDLDLGCIEIKNGTILLLVSPVIKNAIFVEKENLKKELDSILSYKIRDIR